MEPKSSFARERAAQIASQDAYRQELGSQAAVLKAKKAQAAEEKQWAAEEMQMQQEVIRQKDELRQVQAQVQKRELADAYAAQVKFAKQGKDYRTSHAFQDSSRAEAVEKWISDSKDEVAERAAERERRELAAKRQRQAATNEVLRLQIEEKRQREQASKNFDREQAEVSRRQVEEGLSKEAEEADHRKQQKSQFARDLDAQRATVRENSEPAVVPKGRQVEDFASGRVLNKENPTIGRPRKTTESKPVHLSSPYSHDTTEPVTKKPPARSSAPYAVSYDAPVTSKCPTKPRSVAPFALHDELEEPSKGHPTDIPGVPRNLTAYSKTQHDLTHHSIRPRPCAH